MRDRHQTLTLDSLCGMKIAFPTRDTSTITGHFGKMKAMIVIEVIDGVETSREARDMTETPLTMGGTQSRPIHIVSVLSDCDALIAGGMGLPIEQRIRTAGTEVILTSVRPIDEALDAYLDGTLGHQPDLAHHPDH
jgi:predicted Fe-Mo cluster-binding NifX family protein